MPDAPHTLTPPARMSWRGMIEIGNVRYLQWSPYTLYVPGLPARLDGLRVLHLTDIHLTPRWMPALDRLHERVAARPPDLVCITGDFVEAKHDAGPSIANVRRFIAGLPSRLGVFATLGNHDGDVLPTLLADWPVRLLCNEVITLRDGDTAIELIGLHGVEPCDSPPRVLGTLPPRSPGALRLALVHFPAQAHRFAPGDADIVLAGHTHGGQVCLPGGWPLITHDPLPRRFAKGVHWLDDRWLVVGRGIGFSTHAVRAFCPAEAIELTLVSTRPPAPAP